MRIAGKATPSLAVGPTLEFACSRTSSIHAEWEAIPMVPFECRPADCLARTVCGSIRSEVWRALGQKRVGSFDMVACGVADGLSGRR